MAHPTKSKDVVAASMKRRLNPDDYMSDPKKTSITMGNAKGNEPTRSYFHASNSLAQLRSRNPLPERYKGGSGGMVDIDGQQYYQPGILNKEDIASRFRSQVVNPDAKNYGLRGEEDRFTGRADSSIASMSPDRLRELVGGVAMRVEDAENKRYANMFLKIHDTVEKAPNLREAFRESNKLVPSEPGEVSRAADKGLSNFDIEALGAVQREALADRYARDAVQTRERELERRRTEEAKERERLANAEQIFALSDKEYKEEMDAGSEHERRRTEKVEERERLANAERIFALSDKEYMEEMDAGSERELLASSKRIFGLSEEEESADYTKWRADAALGRPALDILDTLAEEAATGKKGADDAQRISDLRDAEYAEYGNWQDGVQRRADLEKAEERERLADVQQSSDLRDAEYAEYTKWRADVASGRPVRDILDTLAEEAATGKKGAAKTNKRTPEQRTRLHDLLAKVNKRIEMNKEYAAGTNKRTPEQRTSLRDLLDKVNQQVEMNKEYAAGTNKRTPEQRTSLRDLLDKVNQQVEMNKKYAAEDAPGEGGTEIPVDEADDDLSTKINKRIEMNKEFAARTNTPVREAPAKTNAPPSRSLPAGLPYRSPEGTSREHEARMEEAGRRNKQWDDLTKKLIPKQDAKIKALMVEAEKKGLSKAEVDSRWMDIHLLMDPESEAAFAPLRREKARAQETERQRWAKIHAEIRQAKEQAKEQETDLDRYYTPRKVSQLKAELTRRLNNANPLGGRPPLRRSGPLPFGLDRLFPEAPPPNVSREQYVNGPYVDSANGRYVIGPEHPLFELEKQQQYRRGFVTKYNAEGGFYYTQFDKDLAYSLGVLNDE